MAPSAVEVLRRDHRCIDALLNDCLRVAADEHAQAPSADRNALLERLAARLRVHADIEVNLFYPAIPVSALTRATAQLDHAEIVRQLNGLLVPVMPGEDYERRLIALAQLFRSHVGFEEEQLFPQAASLDLEALGIRLAMRRGELLGEQGAD
ncbi:MAG: hemerythrin domain-containing protein [Pseudomonadota bacterium]|nr:hemerythrin domain-containing protein [Pseudomonadota bacterium]